MTLYNFADLELPDEMSAPASDSASGTQANGALSATEESSLEIEQYQNLLASRASLIAQQQQRRTDMLTTLQTWEQQLESYAELLTEARASAQQHYAAAIELRRRLGRGEITDDAIPEGIVEILKGDIITELEHEMNAVLNRQTHVHQQLNALQQPDDTLNELQTLFQDILQSVGERLDTADELHKLEQDLEHDQEAISPTALKAREQTAIRLMEADETLIESIFSLIPSERANNLTELLSAYYQELVELQVKRENLQTQHEKTNTLIQLSEAERTAVAALLPYMQKQADQLESQHAEEQVKIRARLVPQKADKLLDKFEAETGRRLALPPPVNEAEREAAIGHATDSLFELHIRTLAANKWIAIFKQRLSPSGLDAENSVYQYNLGATNVRISSIERRIQGLQGASKLKAAGESSPDDSTTETTPDSPPVTTSKISLLREERHNIRRQYALLLFVRLPFILISAIVLNWMIERLIRWNTRRSERKDHHSASVLLPLSRSFLKFMIWMVALITGLSSLGFDVGAVLAGLGIGGLAIAMASKDTLSNLIGGINLLLTKPLKVGDEIHFNKERTVVEEIGLRYTKLRNFSGNFVVTVPNARLAEVEVINRSAHSGFIVTVDIPLSIRNEAEKIPAALQLVTDIIQQHPDTDFIWAIHDNFTHYSFGLKARYDVREFSERNRVRTEINAEIVNQFQQQQIEFSAGPLLENA